MKKADNFDAKQWLVENKITTNSKSVNEENLSSITSVLPLPKETLLQVLDTALKQDIFSGNFSKEEILTFTNVVKDEIMDGKIKTIDDIIKVIKLQSTT